MFLTFFFYIFINGALPTNYLEKPLVFKVQKLQYLRNHLAKI